MHWRPLAARLHMGCAWVRTMRSFLTLVLQRRQHGLEGGGQGIGHIVLSQPSVTSCLADQMGLSLALVHAVSALQNHTFNYVSCDKRLSALIWGLGVTASLCPRRHLPTITARLPLVQICWSVCKVMSSCLRMLPCTGLLTELLCARRGGCSARIMVHVWVHVWVQLDLVQRCVWHQLRGCMVRDGCWRCLRSMLGGVLLAKGEVERAVLPQYT